MSKADILNINTGYGPRPFQQYLHARLERFNVLVCHRRFGKTVFSINEIIDQGLRNQKHNPRYAYMAPTYKQAKRISWDYFVDFTRNIPGAKQNKADLEILIEREGVKENGIWVKEPDTIKFMLLGSDNPDSIRGIYLDGAVIDEYAQCDPIIWGEVVRPALADRKGWVIFIGTPKGKNHFSERYQKAVENPSWYTCIFKASETNIVDPEELAEMKLDMNDSEYRQEMECDFEAAIIGSYYGHILTHIQDEGHIGDYFYDPAYPVDTFWDLGMHDALSIWFRQKLPGGFRYIDYYEVNGKSLPEVVTDIKSFGYSFGRHVIPWDGAARELGSGNTRQEILQKLGLRPVEIQKRQTVDDRIQASRIMLRKSQFNADKCAKGIEALRNYQKEFDSKKDMFVSKPKHDWASHAADSFGYSALDVRDSKFSDKMYDDLPRQAISDYNEFGS